MALAYAHFTLTEAGEDLATQAIAGTQLQFKRIAIGDGFDYDVDNFPKRTELENEVLSLTNLRMTITSDNVVTITGSFASGDLENSFYYREIGLFVVDPEDEDNEILYGYGNLNDAAEYITPDVSGYGVLKECECVVMVGKASNVNIVISENSSVSVINFESTDWTLDTTTNLYTMYLGAINEGIGVYKNTANGRILLNTIDILKENNNITIRSLSAFNGCIIAAA